MKYTFEQETPARLDVFLASCGDERLHSRSFVGKLIADGLVLVDGKKAKKSLQLELGQVVDVDLPAPEPSELQAEDIPLDVVYEDEFLAVINKPAGLTVHPAPGNYTGTLVHAMLHRWPQLNGADPLRPGIVHRLDKDTSGLIVVAFTPAIQAKLSQIFAKREVQKHYLALACGTFNEQSGEFNAPLARSRHDYKKIAVNPAGREALTLWQVKQMFRGFSYLELELKTGRTHQIRVHLAASGHPVLGDQLYNNLKQTLNFIRPEEHKKIKLLLSRHLTRQALHAARLEFCHPVSGQLLSLTSPLPPDFTYALNMLSQSFA